MKIAQIAPLMESVPPRLYGGTERIVSWLTEELVAQGHDVTLFASGDSVTGATLVPCTTEAIRLSETMKEYMPYYTMMVDRVSRLSRAFDIVHFHIDMFQFPLFRGMEHKTMTTLHGRQDMPDLYPFYRAFPKMPLVSISDSQRLPVPDANFAGTVLHGLPANLHQANLNPADGGYLAFLGRISPEKRPDRAIKLARSVGMPLKIAAKVDKVDTEYFDQIIKPLLNEGSDVEFVGEVDERGKTKFLGNARALLFPIDWPEPFGLVMIEAMACGTPVLAFNHGSVPEVIDDGITGRIVGSMEEAVAALPSVLALDRRAVRARFDERFTAARMARDYVKLYQKQIDMGEGAHAGERGRIEAERSISSIMPLSDLSTGRTLLTGETKPRVS
ncbi:glycosyltransferase family 4 protein [Lichenihabitans sp. Uapishka_5]|uniref:glycosyltransferase family 4 protein n=1 Tax=Lichenihabitans sp. Uapishka_5 TaxID=3037302 RepID=UPI0029E7F6D6|nr:glycosyltransferase family 4 protein [Lichenihabitans sp. Uapishka_5]MDX7950663.1 glycosyltransferase family 4 protein [Lichenihabitans sp. Uapishka_5]